jgi:hypothetical protein
VIFMGLFVNECMKNIWAIAVAAARQQGDDIVTLQSVLCDLKDIDQAVVDISKPFGGILMRSN